MSSPFAKSSELPVSFRWYIPKPLHDPTNTHCIIISTYYNETETTPGIYKYNIETNESQIIYKYNNILKPCAHGQFINTSNNTLILYGR
eukprot:213226_1